MPTNPPAVLSPALEMELPARIHAARLAVESDPLLGPMLQIILSGPEIIALDDHLADQCAKDRPGAHADGFACVTCSALICEDCGLTPSPTCCVAEPQSLDVHCSPGCRAKCESCAEHDRRIAAEADRILWMLEALR